MSTQYNICFRFILFFKNLSSNNVLFFFCPFGRTYIYIDASVLGVNITPHYTFYDEHFLLSILTVAKFYRTVLMVYNKLNRKWKMYSSDNDNIYNVRAIGNRSSLFLLIGQIHQTKYSDYVRSSIIVKMMDGQSDLPSNFPPI